MSNHYIGLDLFDLENNGLRQPISRITLYRGDNAALTAGDDTGMEVVADCIYVTQEMVEALLSAARGYQYHAYSAQAARLNPAAELGDTVEVGNIVSVLAQISDHGDLYPDIAAPGDREVEDEYPAAGPLTQALTKAFDKKLAEARSEITKTTDQITLAIYGEDNKGGLNGRMNTFTMGLSGISNEIKGYKDTLTGYEEQLARYEQDLDGYSGEVSKYTEEVNGYKEQVISYKGSVDGFEQRVALYQEQAGKTQEAYSLIDQKVTSIKLQVTNNDATASIQLVVDGKNQGTPAEIKMNGLVTFASLGKDGTTSIDGSRITTGTISADRINLRGKLTFADFTEDTLEEFMTEEAVTEITKDTIKTTNISASRITSGTLDADKIDLDGLFSVYHGNTLCGKIGDHYSLANGAGIVVAGPGNGAGYMRASSEGAKVAIGSYEIGVFDNGNNAGCFSTHNINVNSDRRLKANINYQLTKEEELFMKLRSCSFELKNDPSKKKRWGFIAQDVIAGAKEVGMDSDKLAFIAERNGLYSISYGELTAINTHMIQKLMNRVAQLEAQA